jgi:hypothetical protein
MGAIGLNGAAAQVSDPTERATVAVAGWKRWAPLSATATGAHLAGGAMIVVANRPRIAGQAGVGSWTTAKTALTAAALIATVGSGVAGAQLARATNTHVSGATEPSADTPPEVARAQNALRPLQWAIPLLTGAIVITSAKMGEQQRPSEVASGLLISLTPT